LNVAPQEKKPTRSAAVFLRLGAPRASASRTLQTDLAVTPKPRNCVTATPASDSAVDETSERMARPGRTQPNSVDPRLLVWLSPAFPVGAFAYSHGLELAVDRGWLRNATDLQVWLSILVSKGSLRNDLVILAAAWRAADALDFTALAAANDLALALQPSAERHLETVTQGNAFLATLAAAWPCERLSMVMESLSGDLAYPVAIGLGAASHGVAMAATLNAYGVGFVTSLTSAAIRLSLTGQTDGQRVIAALMPLLAREAVAAEAATLDDVGGSTLRADLASLAHETQYSRLFRS
jgi:urease accessory protein